MVQKPNSFVRFVVRIVSVFWLGSSLIGCSLLERSPNSGYSNQKYSGESLRRISSVPQKTNFANTIGLKTHLKSLENSLTSRKELEQYSKALPMFKNEQEKINFLMLSDFEERARWMNETGFSNRNAGEGSSLAALAEEEDIALGMPQSLVKKSWGDPESIEVSGNPVFKNERWRYTRQLSGADGYKTEKRVVYFEGGKVVGWDRE